MPVQRDHVTIVDDLRKRAPADHLDRRASVVARKVERDGLRRSRQVRDAEHEFALELADVGRDVTVVGMQKGDAAATEHAVRLTHADDAPHPLQERRRTAFLRFGVGRGVAVHRIHDRRQVEALRVGTRETAVAVGRPLHRRAHAVAVAEVDVVAHPDLIAVVDDRSAGHREQQARHQFDLAAIVFHQRREPPANADVDARARLLRVDAVHEGAFAVGDHLERQLVVVT